MRLQLRELAAKLEPGCPDWRLLEGATITLRDGQTRQIASVDFGSGGAGAIFRILPISGGDLIAGGYTVAAIESGLFVEVALDTERSNKLHDACERARTRAEARIQQAKQKEELRRQEQEAAQLALRREEEARAAFVREAEEKRRAKIAEVLNKTGLKRLVHVTRVENLQSILWWGMFPPCHYRLLPSHPVPNDPGDPRSRLDRTVFFYLAHPCDEEFQQWQESHRDGANWAVLEISPSLLLEKRCGFYVPMLEIASGEEPDERESQEEEQFEATELAESGESVRVAKYHLYGQIRYTGKFRRSDDVTFESVFAEPLPESSNVNLSFGADEPRSPWTIACVEGIVSPQFIAAIHVRDRDEQRKLQDLLDTLDPPVPDLRISPQLFERRPSAAQFFLNNCRGIEKVTDEVDDASFCNDSDDAGESLGRWERAGDYRDYLLHRTFRRLERRK